MLFYLGKGVNMKGKIVETNNILRGPARLLYYSSIATGGACPIATEPTTISDILADGTISGAAGTGWTDFGAVEGAVTHQRELTTDQDVVENSLSPIRDVLIGVKDTVIANLAEVSFENLQVAWELGGIVTNSGVTPNEKTIPFSVPESLTPRMIAFVHAKPDGKLRAHVFWNVTPGNAASGLALAKTPKGTIPVQFNCAVMTDIVDSNNNPTIGKAIEQVSA